MITRQKKQETVASLVELLQGVQGLYFLDFTTMSVAETIKLRRALKQADLKYRVAKNTLIDRAINEVGGFDLPDSLFVGQTGIVFSYDDPVIPAKIIKEESEKTKKPVLKGAILDGQYFDGSKLKDIAALPGKKEMMSAIVGSLHAPITGIVGSINAVMRDVASLIEEVAKKKAS